MNHKILIVGTNKEYIQTVMQFIIEDSVPYALLSAFNGKSGVEIALKEKPDIIIMNWEVNETAVIESIKQLKDDEITKYIPIIISTSSRFSPTDLKTAFDAGASDFIRKPLEKTEFLARMSSHLKIAQYLKTIKTQEKIIASSKINFLNEKIDFLQSKLNDNNALFELYNETLKSIQQKLDSVPVINQNSKKEIQKISVKVKQSINSFRRNYSDYYKPGAQFAKKLLDKHNNLTPQEIQLCYMLKNKLCTKDIATITFREESSVKVSRSRLRRKLMLNESENLHAYIDNF